MSVRYRFVRMGRPLCGKSYPHYYGHHDRRIRYVIIPVISTENCCRHYCHYSIVLPFFSPYILSVRTFHRILCTPLSSSFLNKAPSFLRSISFCFLYFFVFFFFFFFFFFLPLISSCWLSSFLLSAFSYPFRVYVGIWGPSLGSVYLFPSGERERWEQMRCKEIYGILPYRTRTEREREREREREEGRDEQREGW